MKINLSLSLSLSLDLDLDVLISWSRSILFLPFSLFLPLSLYSLSLSHERRASRREAHHSLSLWRRKFSSRGVVLPLFFLLLSLSLFPLLIALSLSPVTSPSLSHSFLPFPARACVCKGEEKIFSLSSPTLFLLILPVLPCLSVWRCPSLSFISLPFPVTSSSPWFSSW